MSANYVSLKKKLRVKIRGQLEVKRTFIKCFFWCCLFVFPGLQKALLGNKGWFSPFNLQHVYPKPLIHS